MSCSSCKPQVGHEEEGKEEFPGPTTNACKLCTPLGACLAYKGIAGAVPFLHGSQGCATYIRRYLISHFLEPMDIAASNFAEHSAVFGGREVLHDGIENVSRQYNPQLIGIATTCLRETISENMPQLLHEYNKRTDVSHDAALVHVSTPSFKGTHVDGYHKAVRSIVEALATAGTENVAGPVALMPGFVSAEDLRHLRELFAAYELPLTMVPDYSETMDGGSWAAYERIPVGGTTVEAVKALGSARAAIECGHILATTHKAAGAHLADKFSVPLHRIGLPIGLRETDRLCEALGCLASRETPVAVEAARGRLIDAMVDGHNGRSRDRRKNLAWIRDGRRPMRGLDAAKLLLERQLDAIVRLKEAGMVVKINSIIIPGVNDQHIEAIASKVAELKVDIMNSMAFLPVAGAEFENIAPPDNLLVASTRLKAGRHVAQMSHCARFRADAVGLINEKMTEENLITLQEVARPGVGADEARPYIAVASQEGMLVNQHLGEAARVIAFKEDKSTPSGFSFVEVRKTPEPGAGPARWSEFADILHDCRSLLVSAAGPQPKRALEDHGVAVVEMEGMIEEGLSAIFAGKSIPASLSRRFTSCGSGCKGTGTGCA